METQVQMKHNWIYKFTVYRMQNKKTQLAACLYLVVFSVFAALGYYYYYSFVWISLIDCFFICSAYVFLNYSPLSFKDHLICFTLLDP